MSTIRSTPPSDGAVKRTRAASDTSTGGSLLLLLSSRATAWPPPIITSREVSAAHGAGLLASNPYCAQRVSHLRSGQADPWSAGSYLTGPEAARAHCHPGR